MKKQLFSLLLALCLVFTMVPAAAFATGGSTSADENLLVNPGGEIIDGGTALTSNGWEGSNRFNAYPEEFQGIESAQEGTYYMAVGAPNSASVSSAPLSCYQDIAIPVEKAGGTYALTGYLRASESSNGNRATLRIGQLNLSGNTLSGSEMERSTSVNSWTQADMTANLLPDAKFLRVTIEGMIPYTGAAAFDNLSLTLTPPPSVAVNTTTNTEYPTLEAAVNAVAEGQTIQLLDDITLNDTYLYIAYNFTLDLNGYTLTKSSDSSDGNMIYHEGGGTLTIIDDSADGGGRITSALSTPGSGIIYMSSGDLTLRNVTVENTAEDGNAIKNDSGGQISIPGGNVVLRGGGFAMDTAPDLDSNVEVIASTDVSGTPTAAYDPDNITTYKYLAFHTITGITNLTLTDQLIAPAVGAAPAAAITEDPQYTGTVSWDGNPSKFLGGTAYTATVTLTAKSGYTFQGVGQDTFSYAGATSVTNAAGSGNTMTVTVVFPATAARTLQSIAVTTAPDKTVYQFGETFEGDGMTVRATYNDDTEDTNFTAYTVDKTGVLTMSDTIITLTATADSSITATQSLTINKADGVEVTGVAAEGCTTSANQDGKLTGVTAAMEYRKSGDAGYTSGTGSDITGLANGTYDVRMKETATHSAGADSSFTVTVYVPTHTITAAAGTGGSISPDGSVTVNHGANQTFTIAPHRSYSIDDVKVDNVSQGRITSFTFTNVTANHTISAAFRYSGGGGGSGDGGGGSSSDNGGSVIVTPPVTGKPNSPTQGEVKLSGIVDGQGNATVNVTSKSLTEAFDKALSEARKNGREQNGITLVLSVNTGNKTVNNVTVNLPKTASDTIVAKKIVNTVVVVDHPDITIDMDLETVKEINRQANADASITATRADSSKLTGSAKTAVGSRPVFDLKVNYGSGKAVPSFGEGNVSVTIPYTLGANEKAGKVQAVYVDANGKLHWLAGSVYDSANKVLRFSTSHFSIYGVGYKQDAPSLTDISAHWAKDDIQFVVNRGLLVGTSSTTFSPNAAVTRGMFVTALGRLANADVSSYRQSSFGDVKDDGYYMGYIEWASKNGIVNGIGNGKFAPNQPITREQMAIVMQSYARAIGFTLPKAYAENTFADDAQISAYAGDAVKQMQMAGVLSGKNGNRFDPQGTATRAEASAVLQRFIKSTEKYNNEIN